jgi:hypothetical protein
VEVVRLLSNPGHPARGFLDSKRGVVIASWSPARLRSGGLSRRRAAHGQAIPAAVARRPVSRSLSLHPPEEHASNLDFVDKKTTYFSIAAGGTPPTSHRRPELSESTPQYLENRQAELVSALVNG